MPQYQGVWTLEQQAQAQSNQQWVTDPNFKNTTLLLQADGTGSGSQNNTFLDGSTNNFFITRNGNTTQGSFSPFSQAPGYWGNYFNGSSDYLVTNSSTALNLGANDFTAECWFYTTSTAATQTIISGVNATVGSGSWLLQINNTGQLRFFCLYNGGTSLDYNVGTGTVPTNTWNHFAVTRNGANLRIFFNGTQVGTTNTTLAALSIDNASGNYTIGQVVEIRAGWYFAGYISNLRVVIGTALYTSTFIPSTTPLTAVTNTKLLTSQSNRFLDNSTNALTFTTGGTPSVQAFGPFAPALQWTPDVVGGSGYFDGTGDNLSTGIAAALNFGTGDFTIECWYYLTSTTNGDQTIMSNAETGYNSTVKLFKLYYAGQSFPFFDLGSGNGSVAANNTSARLNQWNHAAIVRSGNTFTMYLNGVGGTPTTFAGSVNMNSNSNTYIGYFSFSDPNSRYTGYVSGLRAVTSAVYTANFTPPTTPPTAITNTQLLLNYTNAGIYDGKMGCVAETVSTAQVSTSPVKYGTGSIKFNGSTDRLTIKRSDLFDFGTGDFTIESWILFNSVSTIQAFATNYQNSTTGWGWQWRSDTGIWNFGYGDTPLISYTNTPVVGTWIHSAVSRSGNVLRMFVNGVLVATVTNSTNMSGTTTDLTLGVNPFSGGVQYFNGYLDDFRITKGVGRYTANFTPPQQALPRQ